MKQSAPSKRLSANESEPHCSGVQSMTIKQMPRFSSFDVQAGDGISLAYGR